ncbi:hypothetical protein F2P44_11730 [Massilia sp. CCM 8695]|uniref:Chromosome partitioning protein ParB n=1 Tax=Massilia frigida TaxID=2609281 RepID=A0ABX0NBV6_9BURK|nr:hypothetical protein [Massilia frigida]NHZ79941.1 hypothetical protein [Massilia frigida]
MKPNLKSNASKGVAGSGSAPEVSPKSGRAAISAKPVFALSTLKVSKPRTAKDIERAVAQGRVAELKPD